MKILRHLKVPTGDILVVEGEKGSLEMLSLGDYGKDVNLKADCLGLEREINEVNHTDLLPLEQKWVVTISPQYGCSMGCRFCDVPKVGKGINATENDLIKQVLTAIKLHPEVEYSKRLNIHFARMGEPTFNPNVLDATKWMKTHLDNEYHIHPVVSTIMPKHNEWLKTFIHTWMRMKNRLLKGEAGLQLSINSTNESERNKMFNNQTLPLKNISKIMEGIIPNGRKVTLNFIVNGLYEINPEILREYFDTDDYIIKLTPMHLTSTALSNYNVPKGMVLDKVFRSVVYNHEKHLKEHGYDVLVFFASKEEDLGRITCGNAILSGTLPLTDYKEMEI